MIREQPRPVSDLIKQWERHANGLPNSLNPQPELAIIRYDGGLSEFKRALRQKLTASAVESGKRAAPKGRLNAIRDPSSPALTRTASGRFIPRGRGKGLSPGVLWAINPLNGAASVSQGAPSLPSRKTAALPSQSLPLNLDESSSLFKAVKALI